MNVTELYTFNQDNSFKEPLVHNVYPGFKSLEDFGYPNYSINIYGDIINNVNGHILIKNSGGNSYNVRGCNNVDGNISSRDMVLKLFWMEENVPGPFAWLLDDVKHFKSLPLSAKKIINFIPTVAEKLWVTNDGFIWWNDPIMKRYMRIDQDGYHEIQIRILPDHKDKYYRVHRIVARAFCPKPEHLKDVPYEELQVNHKDGNKRNNNWWNLEWCTDLENKLHAIDTKLIHPKYTLDEILYINDSFNQNIPANQVAKVLGKHPAAIREFKRNPPRYWKEHLTPEKWTTKDAFRYITKEMDLNIQQDIIKNHFTREQVLNKYNVPRYILTKYLCRRKSLREVLYQNEKDSTKES